MAPTLALTMALGSAPAFAAGTMANQDPEETKARMEALYGENHEITDGDFDEALAVKCVNGTFVGRKNGDVIAFKGISLML